MTPRSLHFFSVFALVLAAPPALAQASPRAVLLERLVLPDRLQEFRETARRQVEEYLRGRGGWQLLDSQSAVAPCDDRACVSATAAAAGAPYALVIAGQYLQSGHYDLHVTLWRDGEIISEEKDPCLNCTAAAMTNKLLELTQALVDRENARRADLEALAPPPVLPPAPPPPSAPPDPAALVTPPVSTNPLVPQRSYRWLGWALVGSSGALAAGSVALWLTNDHATSCQNVAGDANPCRQHLHTTIAAVTTAASAAVALAGAGLVFYLSPAKTLALVVQPTGTTIGGSF